MKLNETTLALSNGTELTVIHDLPIEGVCNSLMAAFDNWIVRTNEYTAESFVKYVRSKDVFAIIMTRAEYDAELKSKQL